MKNLKEFTKQIIKGDDESPAVKYYYLILSSMGFFIEIMISIFAIIALVNATIEDPLSKILAIIVALFIVLPLEVGYILFKSDKYDF